MPESVSRVSDKAGLPPGSIVFVGQQRSHKVQIHATHYDGAGLSEQVIDEVSDIEQLLARSRMTWVNIDGVHDVELIRRIGELLQIHPLILEDIANTGQRPRIEEYGSHLYVVIKMLAFDDAEMRVKVEQVSLVIGERYLISFLEDPGDVFEAIRHRLRVNHTHLRSAGPDYLAYTLLDTIVDYYFLVLERLGERAEDLEQRVVLDPSPEVQHSINKLRRELIYVRRALWPARQLFSDLERSDSPLIHRETRQFIRDVHGHAIQVLEVTESLRDVIASIVDIYMTSLSNRMNEIMKFLTMIGTIFIPLTFIAGVYGMNFDYMPELRWRYGYAMVWALMIGVGIGMVLYFRKRRWL